MHISIDKLSEDMKNLKPKNFNQDQGVLSLKNEINLKY